MMADTYTLPSISEYGEDSRPVSGFTSSTYLGYTRSPSGESLNTLASGSRNHNNGLQGERRNEIASKRYRKKSFSRKGNYELCKKVRVTVALIGILLLVVTIFMLSFYLPKQYETFDEIETEMKPSIVRYIWDENIEIKDNMSILFSTNFSAPVLESELGPDIALYGYFGELLSDDSKMNYNKSATNDSITMTFTGVDRETSLIISKVGFHDQCYEVYWVTKSENLLKDCFDTDASHWFGLGLIFNQQWPISKISFDMTSFITTDYLVGHETFGILGGVLEPFMINSKGAGIYVSETVKLFVGLNENGEKKFCIQSGEEEYIRRKGGKNELNYTICIADNIKQVHTILFNKYIEKPTGYPDEEMLTKPIWSTWAKYKELVNQSVVLKFADEIKMHNFEVSHLVIDGPYFSKYGDMNFDQKKFDDYGFMINKLRSDEVRTIVGIVPAASLESKFFLEGLDYWVKTRTGSKTRVPGISTWWFGLVTVLDLTNALSREWFTNRLKEFMTLKLDGFKFDGGEVNLLPYNYGFSSAQPNPNYYTKLYVKLASQFPLCEVRVGYKSQKYPIFVRLIDRSTNWDSQNGLRSVLSAVLTLGILGYPFILPDMVGGNAYRQIPNKELYVRWAQLCAFLPAIQFSLPPWEFGQEGVDRVKDALDIRKKLSDYIVGLAKNVSVTGDPIIRPLWWYWPKDHEVFVIDAEFMLGSRYLIAPVLNPHIIKHAIYLPAGVWEEQWGERKTLNMTEGSFKHYNVTLKDICYFRLVKILAE